MSAPDFVAGCVVLEQEAPMARAYGGHPFVQYELHVATRDHSACATLTGIVHEVEAARMLAARWLGLSFDLAPIGAEFQHGYWRGAWHMQLEIHDQLPVTPVLYTDEGGQ